MAFTPRGRGAPRGGRGGRGGSRGGFGGETSPWVFAAIALRIR
jgi:hypothetical protein